MEHQQSRNEKLIGEDSQKNPSRFSGRNNIYVSVGASLNDLNDNGNVQYHA